jgi:hypothetical protein
LGRIRGGDWGEEAAADWGESFLGFHFHPLLLRAREKGRRASGRWRKRRNESVWLSLLTDPTSNWSQASWTRQEAQQVKKIVTDPTARVKSELKKVLSLVKPTNRMYVRLGVPSMAG